jgi:hypothetical protein
MIHVNESVLITGGAMLRATVAALACLCLARTSPASSHNLRVYTQNNINQKASTFIYLPNGKHLSTTPTYNAERSLKIPEEVAIV